MLGAERLAFVLSWLPVRAIVQMNAGCRTRIQAPKASVVGSCSRQNADSREDLSPFESSVDCGQVGSIDLGVGTDLAVLCW
jgi:hypothetical protein